MPVPEERRGRHSAAAGQFEARSAVRQRPLRPRGNPVPSVHRGTL